MQDVCTLYPCQEGETCVHKGGATCFDSDGCDPNDLRLCGETIMQLISFSCDSRVMVLCMETLE